MEGTLSILSVQDFDREMPIQEKYRVQSVNRRKSVEISMTLASRLLSPLPLTSKLQVRSLRLPPPPCIHHRRRRRQDARNSSRGSCVGSRLVFARRRKGILGCRRRWAKMAAEMVKAATNNKLKEMDWAKNIEICELVARDPGKAKDVIKSIKKYIGGRSKDAQLYAVMLLEMLMNNCGEPIHREVIDNGLLPILVKIVKKKTELPVREKIFLLLDATQTSLGGAKAKFPQYYEAYYELVSSGVQFSNCPNVVVTQAQAPVPEARVEPNKDSLSSRLNEVQKEAHIQPASDSSIIQKASSVMEVLRDVLNSMDPRHPEGATDEFVLDLVEQCTFQKQRVMHLVMTSRDELMVSQAIELNEELHKVLVQHDALLSVHPTTTVASNIKEEEEEEDAESLYRRLRKGKALSQDYLDDSVPSFRSMPEDKMHRPLTIQPSHPDKKLGALNIHSPDPELRPEPVVSIPPPPAKHAERERFFREKSMDAVSLPDHLRGLSSHSRDGSSSCSGSTDYGD